MASTWYLRNHRAARSFEPASGDTATSFGRHGNGIAFGADRAAFVHRDFFAVALALNLPGCGVRGLFDPRLAQDIQTNIFNGYPLWPAWLRGLLLCC